MFSKSSEFERNPKVLYNLFQRYSPTGKANMAENVKNFSSDTFPLSHFLSKAGVASRRKSCELIRSGKVTVNGKVISEPGFKVSPDDCVKFNNKILYFEKQVYILLNKPVGYICTNDDKYAEFKVMDLIDISLTTRLFTAGRLDKLSEGLIIISNDGDYVHKLTHPSFEITKTYIVHTDKPISDYALSILRRGICDKGDFLKPVSVEKRDEYIYQFVMSEGKKHEVRRLVKSTGREVLSLKRIKIGTLELGNLKPGEWRYMTKTDIYKSLRNEK